MRLAKLISYFGGLLFTLGLVSCEKAVEVPATVSEASGIRFSVADTLLVSYTVDGKTFANQRAFRIKIIDETGRNPAADEPVIYNVYKSYSTGTQNLVCRIFGGGAGFPDSAVYSDSLNRTVTMRYKASLDTLVVIGSDNKNEYRFSVAALAGMLVSNNMLYGGFERRQVFDEVVRGGGLNRFLNINDNDPYTVTNVARVAARINTEGIDSLFYIRYSQITASLPFSVLFGIDSMLRNAGPADTQTIAITSAYRMQLADSVIVDLTGLPIGRFGGMAKVAVNNFSAFFNRVDSLHSTVSGETGFRDLLRIDTLTTGPGQKWIYLYNRTWAGPLSDYIDIRPWNMEVLLDENNSRASFIKNTLENKTCLTSDNIPFVINNFNDTTFDNEVWVWMATRNIRSTVMKDGSIQDPQVFGNDVQFSVGLRWPDAVLETPPERFGFPSGGYLKGELNPDYTGLSKPYRVSPLAHMYLKSDRIMPGYEYGESAQDPYPKAIQRSKITTLISLMMKKGSLLGYDEAELGDFKSQHYVLSGLTSLQRVPFTGWFEIEPLENISPDRTYDPDRLIAKFSSRFGVDNNTLWMPEENVPGRKYFSIYSAYFYTPEIPHAPELLSPCDFLKYSRTGKYLKLYQNPIRNLPYFVISNTTGSKEFILCVFTRGKYFKEPRAYISPFSSSKAYVWDKIPPHMAWPKDYKTSSAVYAPLYYVTGQDSLVTDLFQNTVPYVFNVWLSPNSQSVYKDCSLRDVGFGRITSVKLCFNYSQDLDSINPVTGARYYKNGNIEIDMDPSYFARQTSGIYNDKDTPRRSYGIPNVAFKNVDARLWSAGLWDMWLETEDDLRNKGVAPNLVPSVYSIQSGQVSVRQVSKF